MLCSFGPRNFVVPPRVFLLFVVSLLRAIVFFFLVFIHRSIFFFYFFFCVRSLFVLGSKFDCSKLENVRNEINRDMQQTQAQAIDPSE